MLPEDLEFERAFPEEYVCDCGTKEAREILQQAIDIIEQGKSHEQLHLSAEP